jgi:hypothetical protein
MNYYVCYWHIAGKQRREEQGHVKCTLPFVWSEYIDFYIWEEIIDGILSSRESIHDFLNIEGIEDRANILSGEVERLQSKRTALVPEKKRLYDKFSKGGLNDPALDALLEEKNKSCHELDKTIKSKIAEREELKRTILNFHKFQNIYNNYIGRLTSQSVSILKQLTFDEKQNIIKHLLKDMKLILVPSTHFDAWYTSRGEVGIELKWEGKLDFYELTSNNIGFFTNLKTLDKKFLEEFDYKNVNVGQKHPDARHAKSGGMRRTCEYAAMRKDERNAADGCFSTAC